MPIRLICIPVPICTSTPAHAKCAKRKSILIIIEGSPTRAFFFLFPNFYLMSTTVPTHKLRSAYYSNHQEAIPTEAATHKQNKLLVMPLTFILSNLLAVVDKRGWHFTSPSPLAIPAVSRRKPCISPVDISQHFLLQDSSTTMAPSLLIR